MTGNTAVGFDRSMLVDERPLLVCVTLNASRIGARGQSCLFKFETSVRVVAITTLHCAFQHFMVERQIELVPGLTMTTEAKLRLAISEQFQLGDTGFLCVCT